MKPLRSGGEKREVPGGALNVEERMVNAGGQVELVGVECKCNGGIGVGLARQGWVTMRT